VRCGTNLGPPMVDIDVDADYRRKRPAYKDSMFGCDYALCVRGAGKLNFRFFETLSAGRNPVLIDTNARFRWTGRSTGRWTCAEFPPSACPTPHGSSPISTCNWGPQGLRPCRQPIARSVQACSPPPLNIRGYFRDCPMEQRVADRASGVERLQEKHRWSSRKVAR
jgi:hypothetical protein